MKRTSSSLPHLARGLFTALVLLSLSSSFAASSDSIPVAAATAAATAAVEATICAVGAKQAADETTTSSCGAFFEPGAPLSSEEVSAIVAGALPAQARSEADSSPFNATVPCPTTLLIGSGIDAARVEAQVRRLMMMMIERWWASETENWHFVCRPSSSFAPLRRSASAGLFGCNAPKMGAFVDSSAFSEVGTGKEGLLAGERGRRRRYSFYPCPPFASFVASRRCSSSSRSSFAPYKKTLLLFLLLLPSFLKHLRERSRPLASSASPLVPHKRTTQKTKKTKKNSSASASTP
jgi:hypothetical protein